MMNTTLIAQIFNSVWHGTQPTRRQQALSIRRVETVTTAPVEAIERVEAL